MKTINTLRKVSLATLLTFVLSFSSVFAQNDTMYVMKNGTVVGQYNVNTEVDSVIFYKPTIEETTSGTFTDSRDGNQYNWVKINNQVWMAENLAYLPSVNMVADGSEDATGSYYYVFGYDGTNVTDAKATANYTTYGVLYNWTAATAGSISSSTNPSGIQGVCPTGWHLPSTAEWTQLTDFLGGISIAGDKLKETGTSHWSAPSSVSTNEYGFSALPGGYRSNNDFLSISYYGKWWSSTENNDIYAWCRYIHNYQSSVSNSYDNKELGFSVRCVKD